MNSNGWVWLDPCEIQIYLITDKERSEQLPVQCLQVQYLWYQDGSSLVAFNFGQCWDLLLNKKIEGLFKSYEWKQTYLYLKRKGVLVVGSVDYKTLYITGRQRKYHLFLQTDSIYIFVGHEVNVCFFEWTWEFLADWSQLSCWNPSEKQHRQQIGE